MRTPEFLLVSQSTPDGLYSYVVTPEPYVDGARIEGAIAVYDSFQSATPLYLEGFRARPHTLGPDWISDDLAFDLTFA